LNSLDHALRALGQYILLRLAPEDSAEYIESSIVTYIWMALSQSSHQSSAEFRSHLQAFTEKWHKTLNSDAAQAAFLLVWKRVEQAESQGPASDVQDWCQIALHPLFIQSGELNIGKVQQKLVSYHMKQPDIQAAKESLLQMSESVRQHPWSLYLAYSVALRMRDEGTGLFPTYNEPQLLIILAELVLASIVKQRDRDNRLLLASVGETMKHGDQRQGALLLQRVLDKFNYDLPADIDTCTMLRCTARLLMSVLSDGKSVEPELLSRLCRVFRAAATYSTSCNAGNEGVSTKFNVDECQWFERHAFNVALQNLESWPAKYVIDMMEHGCQVRL
jgi:Meiosis protein SPO22/ZIP4 like